MIVTAPAPLVIAHRGASAYEPEHTYAAYDAALAMGADVLELDVRLLADDTPVVVHDRTLWRTAADRREAAALTRGELEGIEERCRPLLLSAVLERYGDSTRYLIDLKEPRAPLERLAIAALAEAGLCHRAEVQAFSRPGLRRARRCDRTLSLAQLYPPAPPEGAILADLARVARFARAIGPHATSVDAALVAAAHARGLRVQPYTVNEPAEIERLLALGVDGIITDVPDLVRAAADAELAAPLAA